MCGRDMRPARKRGRRGQCTESVLYRLRKPPLGQLPQHPTLIASTLLGSGVLENHACNYICCTTPVLLYIPHWPPSCPSHMTKRCRAGLTPEISPSDPGIIA